MEGPAFLFFCLFVFAFFRAAPVAHGSSQVRGHIGAAAAGLCHSHGNTGSKLGLRPMWQLMQRRVTYPLSEAGNLTRTLMNASWVRNSLSHSRNALTQLYSGSIKGWRSSPTQMGSTSLSKDQSRSLVSFVKSNYSYQIVDFWSS